MTTTEVALALTPLAAIIEERGLKKTWVAAQLEITPSHLSRLLVGERPITEAMAARLAALFAVPVETFLGGEG